jgi:hypothetical protein
MSRLAVRARRHSAVSSVLLGKAIISPQITFVLAEDRGLVTLFSNKKLLQPS